ncbi:nitrous oxide reductase accessory protein NosL [Mangrovicella endophytica]|uniref:nitrous oxide reductase accessory protein NosL n=1 Tax=Mangrovicella endophytica TaxID=2066697 RepID=UPI000C9E3F83|nr:nitrous oxide reductase accessory protein NosL [Mangrovicella endophytica]
MRRPFRILCLTLLLALPLAGCTAEEEAGKPPAVTMTAEAVGHYCQMYVLEHPGPKAQIHLAGIKEPLWFSQVSDAVAYLHDPEREADITAVYVSDMGKAASWGEPGTDNWTDADTASFVIESRQIGGMGTPEAISFGTREAADAFVKDKGGRVVALKEVPDAYVRAAQQSMAEDDVPPSGTHDHAQ